jgi:hypothetical protein
MSEANIDSWLASITTRKSYEDFKHPFVTHTTEANKQPQSSFEEVQRDMICASIRCATQRLHERGPSFDKL